MLVVLEEVGLADVAAARVKFGLWSALAGVQMSLLGRQSLG